MAFGIKQFAHVPVPALYPPRRLMQTQSGQQPLSSVALQPIAQDFDMAQLFRLQHNPGEACAKDVMD